MRETALHHELFASVPAHWAVVPLTDVVDFQEGPGILAKDFHDSGVPLLRLKSIQGRFATLDGADCLDPDMVERRWSHFSLEVGDLLVSTSATIGIVSEVSAATRGSIAYTGIIRMRPKGHSLERAFLRHFLKSSLFAIQVERMASGSVMRHYGPTHLKQMSLVLPPVGEQKVIAQMLDALDDKIELNRKMSATLDAIARALFKSWFVDFDPLRVKAEGRKHSLPAEIAALFPDSWSAGSVSTVPAGWGTHGLDDVASFLNGLALQKFPPEDGAPTLPVIKIAQLRAGHSSGADRASASVPSDYVIGNGDILFSWSGSLECHIWTGGPGALNQHLFKVSGTRMPSWFAYLAVQEHLAEFRHIAAGKATTMGHIQRHHLHEAKIAVPPLDLIAAANSIIGPIIEASWTRLLQCSTLAALRDALLPKLISGDFRVGDAERVLAASA